MRSLHYLNWGTLSPFPAEPEHIFKIKLDYFGAVVYPAVELTAEERRDPDALAPWRSRAVYYFSTLGWRSPTFTN